MSEISTKPYLIRAIYEWCVDSGYTPYLSVNVDRFTRVPRAYVKDGEIVLNVSPTATHRLTMGNDAIQFSARFGGVSQEIVVPIGRVAGIFARENGQGLAFPVEESNEADVSDEIGDQAQSGTPGPSLVAAAEPAAGETESSQSPGDDKPRRGPPKLQVIK